MPQSEEHKEIKQKIIEKLKIWYGSGLDEYPQSGHDLDNFSVTLSGISMYVEIIWSSSTSNFYRDMRLISRSEADIKLVVVNPDILDKEELVRDYQKEVLAQRKRGVKIWGAMINGNRIIEEEKYLDLEFKQIIDSLLDEFKNQNDAYDYKDEINKIRDNYGYMWDIKKVPYIDMYIITEEKSNIWLPLDEREIQNILSICPDLSSNYLAKPSTDYWDMRCYDETTLFMVHNNGIFHTMQEINTTIIEKNFRESPEKYEVMTYYELMHQIVNFFIYAIRVMKEKKISFNYIFRISIYNGHRYPIMFSGGFIERANRFSEKENIITIEEKFNPEQKWSLLKENLLRIYKRILLSSGCLYDKDFSLNKSLKEIIRGCNALNTHTVNGYRMEGIEMKEFDFTN